MVLLDGVFFPLGLTNGDLEDLLTRGSLEDDPLLTTRGFLEDDPLLRTNEHSGALFL